MSAEDNFLASATHAASEQKAGEGPTLSPAGITTGPGCFATPENQGKLKAAEELFQHGDLQGAERIYRQLLKVAPRHPGISLRLGEICYRGNRLREAAECLEIAAAQRSQDRHLYNTLGYTHLRLGTPDQARKFFTRALGVDQDYFEAWMGLGTSDHALGATRPAMHSFERAVRLRPKSAEAWTELGITRNAMQMPLEARNAFDHAIAADPDFARAYAGRAASLMQLGFQDAATDAICEAVARAPEDVQIFSQLSAIRTFTADDPDLARMTTRADRTPALSGADQMTLDFALAKAFDDCGMAEQAFSHMSRANAAKRKTFTYHEKACLDEMQASAEAFPSGRFTPGEGFATDVPVFIVGMPRCGASLLEQMLSRHPEICGTGECPDFGVCAVGGYTPGTAAKQPKLPAQVGEAYLARMRQMAPRANRILDKRLDNFRFLGTIHRCLPGARIIHVHRDARDCCLSIFLHQFSKPVGYAYNLTELGQYYRAYEQLMAHWRSVLPADAFLEVTYEDLVCKTEAVLRQTLSFIGLEWHSACQHYSTNAHPVLTATAAVVCSPVYQHAIGRAAAYAPWLGDLQAALTENWDADKAGKFPDRHAGSGISLATGTTS